MENLRNVTCLHDFNGNKNLKKKICTKLSIYQLDFINQLYKTILCYKLETFSQTKQFKYDIIQKLINFKKNAKHDFFSNLIKHGGHSEK